VIKDLVEMAETQPYLSLRGTCLYILNMFGRTSEGRFALEELKWVSYWNNNI
jgi:hypothetical protein